MILLTADRPPELRLTGANQSINQFPIFSSYLKWSFDAPSPTTEISPAFVLTSIDQAVQRATMNGMGPIHLNWMFREPLAPTSTGNGFGEYLFAITRWLSGTSPYTSYSKIVDNCDAGKTPSPQSIPFWQQTKGIVIAGRLKNHDEGGMVKQLAANIGWPLYADISSQARLGETAEENEITYIDPYSFSPENSKFLPIPDAVVQFGKTPTSKRLLSWIKAIRPENYVIIDNAPGRIDPMHEVTNRVEADIIGLCRQMMKHSNSEKSTEKKRWLKEWSSIDAQIKQGVENYFFQHHVLSEPMVARIVSEEIREKGVLVLGNSMAN